MGEVTDRPILFSAPMVRAILDGKKSQTRRVLKGQPLKFWPEGQPDHLKSERTLWSFIWPTEHGSDTHGLIQCPYGEVGDRLWVRETWCMNEPPSGALYRATDQDSFAALAQSQVKQGLDLKWKPSIHMPRWASRITLEITKIRVERVQEISEADAQAEGVSAVISKKIHGWTPHVLEYSILWDSINAKRDGKIYVWDKNPWVWVIEFKRV